MKRKEVVLLLKNEIFSTISRVLSKLLSRTKNRWKISHIHFLKSSKWKERNFLPHFFMYLPLSFFSLFSLFFLFLSTWVETKEYFIRDSGFLWNAGMLFLLLIFRTLFLFTFFLSFQMNLQTSENDEDEKEFIVGRILNETGDRREEKNNRESAFETLSRKETFGRLLPHSSTEVTNDVERKNGRNKGWDEDEDESDDLESEHFESHNKPPPLEVKNSHIFLASFFIHSLSLSSHFCYGIKRGMKEFNTWIFITGILWWHSYGFTEREMFSGTGCSQSLWRCHG